MTIKNKINALKNILKKTNFLVYIPQYIWWKLFKKTLFKKVKVNRLVFNTSSYDDVLHLNEYIQNYYNIENIKRLSVCIDIGANSGDFSLMISKKCKRVFSFEPITEVYDKMVANININNIKNITPYNLGVSFECGCKKFMIPKNHTGGSHIDVNGNSNINVISWGKLYKLIGKPPQIDLLKIDCEGCEYSLLKDSAILQYIKEIRLEIHVENNKQKFLAKKLVNLFIKNGFVYQNMTLKQSRFYITNLYTVEHFFIKL